MHWKIIYFMLRIIFLFTKFKKQPARIPHYFYLLNLRTISNIKALKQRSEGQIKEIWLFKKQYNYISSYVCFDTNILHFDKTVKNTGFPKDQTILSFEFHTYCLCYYLFKFGLIDFNVKS